MAAISEAYRLLELAEEAMGVPNSGGVQLNRIPEVISACCGALSLSSGDGPEGPPTSSSSSSSQLSVPSSTSPSSLLRIATVRTVERIMPYLGCTFGTTELAKQASAQLDAENPEVRWVGARILAAIAQALSALPSQIEDKLERSVLSDSVVERSYAMLACVRSWEGNVVNRLGLVLKEVGRRRGHTSLVPGAKELEPSFQELLRMLEDYFPSTVVDQAVRCVCEKSSSEQNVDMAIDSLPYLRERGDGNERFRSICEVAVASDQCDALISALHDYALSRGPDSSACGIVLDILSHAHMNSLKAATVQRISSLARLSLPYVLHQGRPAHLLVLCIRALPPHDVSGIRTTVDEVLGCPFLSKGFDRKGASLLLRKLSASHPVGASRVMEWVAAHLERIVHVAENGESCSQMASLLAFCAQHGGCRENTHSVEKLLIAGRFETADPNVALSIFVGLLRVNQATTVEQKGLSDALIACWRRQVSQLWHFFLLAREALVCGFYDFAWDILQALKQRVDTSPHCFSTSTVTWLKVLISVAGAERTCCSGEDLQAEGGASGALNCLLSAREGVHELECISGSGKAPAQGKFTFHGRFLDARIELHRLVTYLYCSFRKRSSTLQSSHASHASLSADSRKIKQLQRLPLAFRRLSSTFYELRNMCVGFGKATLQPLEAITAACVFLSCACAKVLQVDAAHSARSFQWLLNKRDCVRASVNYAAQTPLMKAVEKLTSELQGGVGENGQETLAEMVSILQDVPLPLPRRFFGTRVR
jgi:hypothetical protein